MIVIRQLTSGGSMNKLNLVVFFSLLVLIAGCNQKTDEIAKSNPFYKEALEVVKAKNETKSEAVNVEDAKPKEVKPKCNVYTENDFREKFTCLFFEERDYYDEYVKQISSVDDCDKFYSDLKNKNKTICEKYRCSKEDLRDHCVELFYDEDDTIDKISECAEKRCYPSEFKQLCDDYEDLCIETVIVSCLNKSGLSLTDYNIRSCAVSNKSLIQKECSSEACIKNEVKTCIDTECKIKPTEKYIRNCIEKEKETCTTQNRTWVVFA